jgi:hypothetical protein
VILEEPQDPQVLPGPQDHKEFPELLLVLVPQVLLVLWDLQDHKALPGELLELLELLEYKVRQALLAQHQQCQEQQAPQDRKVLLE